MIGIAQKMTKTNNCHSEKLHKYVAQRNSIDIHHKQISKSQIFDVGQFGSIYLEHYFQQK